MYLQEKKTHRSPPDQCQGRKCRRGEAEKEEDAETKRGGNQGAAAGGTEGSDSDPDAGQAGFALQHLIFQGF